jgi:hypothetical protein
MNYKIDDTDKSYVKIVAITDISKGDLIGDWVSHTPVDNRCRFLRQPSMGDDIWWETSDIGRYTNHSYTPNTDVIRNGEKLTLYSNTDIKTGEEITVDYQETERHIGFTAYLGFMNN